MTNPGGAHSRRERHRAYAEDLLAQQRQRRSAFVPLGFSITGSLIAAFVALVGASSSNQRIAAGVGAIGLGTLSIHLLQRWQKEHARLITAALRSEMLRPTDEEEQTNGRDTEELVQDVRKRIGEDAETIWEHVPQVLAEEDVTISVSEDKGTVDRSPLVTAKQHVVALGVAGLATALIYSFSTSIQLPSFLGWLETMHTVGKLPSFSVRGLIGILLAALAAQGIFRLTYKTGLSKISQLWQKTLPKEPLAAEFTKLAHASAKRRLIAIAIEPLAAVAFTLLIFLANAQAGSSETTIFLTAYVCSAWLASASLENANIRAVGKRLHQVIESLGEGSPRRVSMRRLAEKLQALTGTPFDAAGVAASLLRRGGLGARFWIP